METDRIPDSVFDGVLRMSVEEMRIWLRDNQPEGPADLQRFWWENLIYRTNFKMCRAEAWAEKGRLALLAHGAIMESLEQGVSGRERVAGKIAELVDSYFSTGGSDRSVFSVDEAVSFSLNSIGIDPEQAVELSAKWSSLSADSAREVSAARELVGACLVLLGRIEDPDLRSRVDQWIPFWDSFGQPRKSRPA